jgi:hypothetical protein
MKTSKPTAFPLYHLGYLILFSVSKFPNFFNSNKPVFNKSANSQKPTDFGQFCDASSAGGVDAAASSRCLWCSRSNLTENQPPKL